MNLNAILEAKLTLPNSQTRAPDKVERGRVRSWETLSQVLLSISTVVSTFSQC